MWRKATPTCILTSVRHLLFKQKHTYMKAVRITGIEVDSLWGYREYKRDETPAPALPFLKRLTLEEITQYVSQHGFEPLELSVVKDKALLTEGNHRMVAARKLGVEIVPVKVTVFFGHEAQFFHQHTLDRFIPLSEALSHQIKELFLESLLPFRHTHSK